MQSPSTLFRRFLARAPRPASDRANAELANDLLLELEDAQPSPLLLHLATGFPSALLCVLAAGILAGVLAGREVSQPLHTIGVASVVALAPPALAAPAADAGPGFTVMAALEGRQARLDALEQQALSPAPRTTPVLPVGDSPVR